MRNIKQTNDSVKQREIAPSELRNPIKSATNGNLLQLAAVENNRGHTSIKKKKNRII